jgi:ATP-dependent RNA helicase DHX57
MINILLSLMSRSLQRRQDSGWSFAITLSRISKRTSQKECVVLEPHPPYIKPTVLEARHWGATYALYRVCRRVHPTMEETQI